jgi:hypothetical protein
MSPPEAPRQRDLGDGRQAATLPLLAFANLIGALDQ